MVCHAPESYLQGVDLHAINPAVLENFVQVSGIQASERTLLVFVIRQKFLSVGGSWYVLSTYGIVKNR